MATNDVTRRDFLKTGAALGAAGLGCGSYLVSGNMAGAAFASEAASEAAPAGAAGAAGTAGAAGAGAVDDSELYRALADLNPQKTDYTSNTTDFATLFSPLQIGSITIPNRIVKSGASSGGEVAEALVPYYIHFAEDGVGLIWMESMEIDKFENFNMGSEHMKWDDIPWAEIAEKVHAAGSFIGLQFTTQSLIYESGGPTRGVPNNAESLTHDEVKLLQQDHIATSKKLKDAGFDGVELNCAGMNIGGSFFSRTRNHREDEYGPQTIQSRALFVKEIIEGIKAECGEDFVIQVLMNAIEENDDTIGDNYQHMCVEEVIAIAQELEAAGADCFEMRLGPDKHECQFLADLMFGPYGGEGSTSFNTQFDFNRHWQGKLNGAYSGCGLTVDVSAQIKQALHVPVGTVIYIDPAHAPDYFEGILAEGKLDFLVLNRPLLCDYNYTSKLKEGRVDEIAPCTRCLNCFGGVCRVAPLSRFKYWDEYGYDPTALPEVSERKKVMVVGGGPGGMEAARVAAKRGYDVSLYESKGSLGGLLPFAAAIKGPHENLLDLNAYLQRQLEVNGVNVVTSKAVDAEFAISEAPDAVILAVGGVRDSGGLTPTAGTSVVSIDEAATGAVEVGHRVTIVGGGCQAVDLALWLVAQGKHVNMVFPGTRSDFGAGHSRQAKSFEQPILFARGTRIWPESQIVEVGDGQVTVDVPAAGVQVDIPCDTVVEAMDMLPNLGLQEELEAAGIEVHAIGDCSGTYSIGDAMNAGFFCSWNL